MSSSQAESSIKRTNELPDYNRKRTDYLEWSDYFMAVAFLSAQKSKDPSTQVGACIVNKDKKIVGIGYNCMPNGCDDDKMPWQRTSDDWLETKNAYICHAELNAVFNKSSADVKDCIIYVTLFPCNECAKVLIQAGIREVIYACDNRAHKPKYQASRRVLVMAGVALTQFTSRKKSVVINFDADGCHKTAIPPSKY